MLSSVSQNDIEEPVEVELPDREWLQTHFKTRSSAIRYLSRECHIPVKVISGYLGVPYRQVYGIIAKMNKEPTPTDKICPVCRRKS